MNRAIWLVIFVLLTLLVVTGCATTQTLTPINVPVPVACQEEMPERPAMPTEAFTAKPSLDQFVQAAQAELLRREGYEGQLRTALEACRKPIS